MTSLGFGCIFALAALWTLLRMEPGLQRLVRLRWNASLRRRVRERGAKGFRMRRSPYFRDAVRHER